MKARETKAGIAELRLRYSVPIVKVGASMEKARPQFRDLMEDDQSEVFKDGHRKSTSLGSDM